MFGLPSDVVRPAVLSVVLGFLGGCQHAPSVDTTLDGVQTRAPVDPALGEVREPHEDERTEAILRATKGKLLKDYPEASTPQMPRDAHQKMHGCMKGTLEVASDLDEAYHVGVFAVGVKTRPVIARLSNSDAKPKPDSTPDARGFAIKMLDVDGDKVILDETHAKTHDFMFINAPTFFVRSLEEYVGVLRAIEDGDVATAAWFATHPHARERLFAAFDDRIENPVTHTYFSATPYNFGGVPAKYRLRPCTPSAAPVPPKNPSPTYLRDAMATTVSTSEVCYHFAVQRQVDAIAQPVEDPTVEWDETAAPFVTVATLRFAAQDLQTPGRADACRKLSFTPWHALPEHRPLGAVNRARLRVYELISRFRNRHNGEPHVEPTSVDVIP